MRRATIKHVAERAQVSALDLAMAMLEIGGGAVTGGGATRAPNPAAPAPAQPEAGPAASDGAAASAETASASGTRAICAPRSETICPNSPACAASAALTP